MRDLGRIHGLGVLPPGQFPVIETVGGVAGAGLLMGGAFVPKAPGIVMMVLGGATLLGSGFSLLVKLTSAPPGAPGYAPPAPPPPPAAPKPSTYQKYGEYAQAALPMVNQLFAKLFGVNMQPHTMVVHSRR